MSETGEEGVAREVLEETGLKVKKAIYQFSLPKYLCLFSFPVHTLDMFFSMHRRRHEPFFGNG
jgi:8-oxo-dGTP pyrophosphatase MutT (NUDIX family)